MGKSSRNKTKKTKKPRKKIPSTRKASAKDKGPQRLDISVEDLKAIVQRAKTGSLGEDDIAKLDGAVDTLALLTCEIEAKGASIRRLRRMIFGPNSEKSRNLFGGQGKSSSQDSGEDKTGGGPPTGSDATEPKASENDATADVNAKADGGGDETDKKKRKGHGRRGAKDYQGAKRNKIPHENLKHKDPCPVCEIGKVYLQKEPAVLVRVHGMAPLSATLYELERLRCNACGEIFTATSPDDIGKEKYDDSAAAMIALLKYGCGMPFNRLERLQQSLGIPLPASTQWEVVEPMAMTFMPVYTELIKMAAQGDVLHNDDTTAKILELTQQREEQHAKGKDKRDRSGTFTSGIISLTEGHQIALFFTGVNHAGENLAEVLKHRAKELGPPIQMSDGLAVNTAGDFNTVEAKCNAHARRRFVDVIDSFPNEVEHVLTIYKAVYKNDDETQEQSMSPKQRLMFHKEHSAPLMEDLERWLQEQFDEKNVEPNSSLGDAITYMQKHWSKLTLFTQKEGVPMDNNIVERAIKKVILHRKNALFFKTQNGADVADIFMAFIHTCELEGVNPFDYLVVLLKHKELIAKAPQNFLPWNYKMALADLGPK